jgi:hypothetical protein
MRKFAIAGILALSLLAACGSAATVKYKATFKDVDSAKASVLMESIERVIIRKLAALGIDANSLRVDVIPTGQSGATVTVHVPDATVLEATKALLAETFTFDIRIEKELKPDGQEAKDNWIPTAVTGSELLWAQATGNRETGEISVELKFNEQGKNLLHEVFMQAKGKHVGIFVRGLLVSKLKIADTALSDRVVIGGIPSDKVAEIFADDVNVGLRVGFSPLP